MGDGGEDDEAGVGAGDLADQLEEAFQFLLEALHGHRAIAGVIGIEGPVVGAVGEFLQAGGHAVAENDDGGFGEGEVIAEAIEAGLGGIEAGTGESAGGVAAPGEIAEGEVDVLEALLQFALEVTGVAFRFEEGVAEEDDAVAVL